MEIVDSIMQLLPPEASASLAARLGTTPAVTEKGVGTSVAALISGVAHHTGEQGFMSRIFELARDMRLHTILPVLPEIASGVDASSPVADAGALLSSMLLRGQQGPVEDFIGRQSGLTPTAGREFMALAAPLTLGFLGHQIHEKSLTLFSFSSVIGSEAAKIPAFLPPGLPNLLSTVSFPSTTGVAAASVARSGAGKWLYALLALIVLGVIAWLASRGCNHAEPPAASETSAPATSSIATAAPGPLGQFIKHTLPDGTVLSIPRLGIENKLIDFIEDKSRRVDKTTWFDFDRLTFDTGKATLQPSSTEQLQNIAAILKAYPNVNVKIGGYTDNTGNKNSNLKLSGDRATNVMHELMNRGTDSTRLEAQGYGEDHPVADNATSEGRQQNRRISLRVTAK